MRTVTLIESWDEYYNCFQPVAEGSKAFTLDRAKFRIRITQKYVEIQQHFAGRWQAAVDISPTFDLSLRYFTIWMALKLNFALDLSVTSDD